MPAFRWHHPLMLIEKEYAMPAEKLASAINKLD